MKLIEALELNSDSKAMISLAGGGGKTSFIFKLAEELADFRKKVLITTTTAIYNPGEIPNPYIEVLGDHVNSEGKLKGISREKADLVYKEGGYDFLLVEADGSRGRPIKAPAEHEPVIPEATDMMVGVIGMDAFGKKICSDHVHRPELLAGLTGAREGDTIDENLILRLVSLAVGLFKGCPAGAGKILLLNKVMDEKTKETAIRIGREVLDKNRDISRVLIGAVKEAEPVTAVIKR